MNFRALVFAFKLSGRFGRCWSLEQFREPEPAAKWDRFSLPGDVLLDVLDVLDVV